MYRRIYFFGCSYTKGAGLSNPYKERYSYHLAKLCSSQHYNFASHAGSDYLSIAQLVSLKEKGYLTEDDLVIFQWTQSARHTLPLGEEKANIFPDGNFEDNKTQNFFHYPFVDAYTYKMPSYYKDFIKDYTSIINPMEFTNFNNNILKRLVASWFDVNNVANIQFSSHIHRVDTHHSGILDYSMEAFTSRIGKTECGHPSAEAHKAWAYNLYSLINKDLI